MAPGANARAQLVIAQSRLRENLPKQPAPEGRDLWGGAVFNREGTTWAVRSAEVSKQKKQTASRSSPKTLTSALQPPRCKNSRGPQASRDKEAEAR
ncbi:hypothetical protein SKAU_G00335740 [Synaphobranchus kaupii]|uniref:Uncharacterized protein n=1 Tax=Synaphobranchus kaupii TaxID=118154 RepID=A0A9Q1EM18_SYNKA|nr:hypothetical protein SKAU_G00335740 [Synaphobranchus kaupii]